MKLKLVDADIIPNREAQYPVNELFINRYSPREYTGEAISKTDLYTAFEAARWAPSSLNSQPWRFIYSMRGTPEFEIFLSQLDLKNQIWAKNAAALIFVTAAKLIEYKGQLYPAPFNEFDLGAAWSNFAHQALMLGYKTRAIGGFDKSSASKKLNIPDDFELIIGVAIGKENIGVAPNISDRKPLNEIVFENKFLD